MSGRRLHTAVVAAVLSFIIVAPGASQTFYGSILGTITDASNSNIPGASVTLTNLGTDEHRSAESDASGNYQFVSLVPGRYKVDIEKAGFKHLTRDQILVEVQSAVRIDAQLQVGDVPGRRSRSPLKHHFSRPNPPHLGRSLKRERCRTCR